MAITWGSVASGGRIGIAVSTSSTNDTTTVTAKVYIWTKYSVSDSDNTLYFNWGATSATTSKGAKTVSTSVSSGSGWSTSNQKLLATYTKSYSRGTSAASYSCAAKMTGVYNCGTMTASVSYTIPKLPSYTISYNGNGATSGSVSSQTKYYGKSLTLRSNSYSRTGYTASKWNTAAGGGGTGYAFGGTYKGNAAATLYCQWTANTYYVKYNGNGNTGGSTAQSTHTYGTAKALTSNGFGRTGYSFSKWNTAANGSGTSYSNGQSVSNLASANGATVNLYAIWTANSYTVKFDATGGSCSTSSKTVTYASTYGTLPTPIRTGYTFAGWYTATPGGTQVVASTTVGTAAGHTLYAHWTVNTYTVIYNGNGATGGSTASSSHTYGTAKALTANGYTRAYYTFTGWNTAANGTGTSYSNGQSVTNLTSTNGATVTLYAQWELAYINPTISDLTTLRYEYDENNNLVEDDSGTHLHVEFTWKVDTTISSTNYATSVKIEYKETSASNWATLKEYSVSNSELTTTSTSGTVSYTSTASFSADLAYNVRVSVTDYYGTTIGQSAPQATKTDILTVAYFMLDFSPGKGVGIGVPAEDGKIKIDTLYDGDYVLDEAILSSTTISLWESILPSS